jgi:hypothetical protein
MKIETPITLKYGKEFIFYDIFVKNEREIIGIGPYQPTVFPENLYRNLICNVGNLNGITECVNDSHKHTLIIKFKFKSSIYQYKEFTITSETFEISETFVLHKREKKGKLVLAMGTMFKNCAKFVKSWIKYHKSIGFEHFYLYDNASNDTDLLLKELKEYENCVTLTYWPYPYVKKPSGISGQTTAQNNCIYKYGEYCKYIALTDLDEYIVSVESSLKEITNMYENQRNDIGGLLIACQWFGCSHRVQYTDDYLLKLIHRKKNAEGFGKGKGPKSLVIPENTKCFAIHRIVNGKPQINVEPELLRFNHYKTLTCTGKNYRQLYRKANNKTCDCAVFDAVKDEILAEHYKNIM